MRELASDREVLRKRLKRLLQRDGADLEPGGMLTTVCRDQTGCRLALVGGGTRYGQATAAKVMQMLQEIGKLALVGGAVRDVARDGVGRFRSDLDFVLYDGDIPAFFRLMDRLGGIRNRFGGFRLPSGRCPVDVWALEHTWARTAGLRRVDAVRDLLDCTFFDWDAIVFDLHTHDVMVKPGYFHTLDARVLDVNLEENPNPRGSLVRALRRGAIWKVRFGPGLTSFARRRMAEENWGELVALDESAFGTPVLRRVDPGVLHDRLARELPWGHAYVTEPFGPPSQQLPLPFQA